MKTWNCVCSELVVQGLGVVIEETEVAIGDELFRFMLKRIEEDGEKHVGKDVKNKSECYM